MRSIVNVYENNLDLDSNIPIGKYKGEPFKEIIKKDKNYLIWLFTKTQFCDINNVTKELLEEVLRGKDR